jgi:CubicO group peptidase (beta-lactamase class C family)
MRTKNALWLLLTLILTSPSPMRGDEPKGAKRDEAAVFPRGEAVKLGIDPSALEKLRKHAEETKSDAVLIVKDGRLIADWDFGQKRGVIETMSATKSIVSLAIGKLIDSGKIKSLDQPISDFYPEWKQGRKKQITVRHLLNHTSGLQNLTAASTEINPSPDFVQLALAAELSDDPGSRFEYNNKAVNLLAGVVQRASGARMDLYIKKEFFEPLGIKDYYWQLDRAGNAHGQSGLGLRAIDLAKIGQMMLDEGVWRGKQILSREWVRKSVEPSQQLDPTCGLLWWLLYGPVRYAVDDSAIKYFKDFGITAGSVQMLEALKGKPFDSLPLLWDSVRPIVRGDDVLKTKLEEMKARIPRMRPVVEGPVRGYEALGWLGQYLVVIPRDRLVAVRQRRAPDNAATQDLKLSFLEFPDMVASLVDKPPTKR